MISKQRISHFLQSLGGILMRPIGESLAFFISMYLLGVVCVLFVPYDSSRLVGVFQLFADLYLLCAFLLLVPQRFRPFTKGVLYALFYVVALIDAFCYAHLGTAFCPTFLQQVIYTNPRECSEFLSLITWSDLWSPFGLVLTLLGAYILLAIWPRKPKCMGLAQMRNLCKPVCAVPVCCLFFVGFFATIDSREYVFYRVICGLDELNVQRMKDFEPKTKYYLPIYRLAYSVSENIQQAAICRDLAKSLDKAVVTSRLSSGPHIVLIIGESCNKRHSSLYGYDKLTTPCQQRMYDTGRLAVFSDVVSPWNVTCEAFQSIMTTHCIGMDGTWASQPLFPHLFRLAGYHTEFFSNQYLANTVGFSAFKEEIFMSNARFSHAMFDVRNDSLHRFDDGLIDDYRALTGKSSKPKLSVFHFLGLHFDFSQRYPASRVVFAETDYSRKDLNAEHLKLLADYDNAYRYNDSIIGEIVKMVDQEEAIVVFLSDHGERIFDDNTQEWGRTLEWSAANIRQQYDIPFWIYVTERYKSCHPRMWHDIQDARRRPFITDAVSHVLLHLAGIQTPWYSPVHDVLSRKYNPQRPRILNRERKYAY